MRNSICASLIGIAAAGCGGDAATTRPTALAAQPGDGPAFNIETFASLGGTASRGNAISNQGWVAGWSLLEDGSRHATLWRSGTPDDLGTLGGAASMVQWPGINNTGMVAGISETAEEDSLGEAWSCEAFLGESDRVCRGFVHADDIMSAMPTLGGTHSFATGVNNRGQVVGWAETAVHDPTCRESQVLQFRAVLWEPRNGALQQLPPLPGDSTSAATAINQRGQVVGISGECDIAVGRFSARHAVLWDQGEVTEIGNLGGTTWHTPMDINEHGDVVGFSNPAGPGDPEGEFIAQAFLWSPQGGTTPLGTLEGDLFSQAHAVNDSGVVVGVSFGGASGSRAFLWADGAIHDFNDLVGGFPGVFQSAQDINDRGQVTGRVMLNETGEVVTFVATPVEQQQFSTVEAARQKRPTP
ncbi:MAG TPA: hypothetical protein VFS94_04315 [Gemmatimonadales bacterium]|nr:hypothetical protein [Gemmatimonadales bacterium]